LFDELKLDEKFGLVVEQTMGGVKSTGEAILKKLANHHTLPGRYQIEFLRLRRSIGKVLFILFISTAKQ
jgi:hypothetical protein